LSHTVDQVGKGTITTGYEKASFTCVLSITTSGEKLPPMIIFERETLTKEAPFNHEFYECTYHR